MIKKADIILAAVLTIAGLAMSYMLSFGQEAGSRAEIFRRQTLRHIRP